MLDISDHREIKKAFDGFPRKNFREKSTSKKLWATGIRSIVGKTLRNLGEILENLNGQITLTLRGAE